MCHCRLEVWAMIISNPSSKASQFVADVQAISFGHQDKPRPVKENHNTINTILIMGN